MGLGEQVKLLADVISKLNQTLVEVDWLDPSNQELDELGDIISYVINIYINGSITGDAQMITQLLYMANYLLSVYNFR